MITALSYVPSLIITTTIDVPGGKCMCGNCAYQSPYLASLPVMALLLLGALPTGLRRMGKVTVDPTFSQARDLTAAAVAFGVLHGLHFSLTGLLDVAPALLLAHDHSHARRVGGIGGLGPQPLVLVWDHALTAIALAAYAAAFLFGHVLPARRHGFSPLAALSRERLRAACCGKKAEGAEGMTGGIAASPRSAGPSKAMSSRGLSSTAQVAPALMVLPDGGAVAHPPLKKVRYNASALEDGVTIREVLDMPVLRDLFIQHCHAAHCEELMEFLAEVQLFKAEVLWPDAWPAMRRMRGMYERFLKTDAVDEINISAGMKAAIMVRVEHYMRHGALGAAARQEAATILDPACEEMERMLGSMVLYQFKKTRPYQVAIGYLVVAPAPPPARGTTDTAAVVPAAAAAAAR